MIFFNPTDKFIDWLIEYSDNRYIIDIGCGDCKLLSKIFKKYKKVIGIDPYIPDKMLYKYHNNIVVMEAEKCSIINNVNSLLVIARPCHNGFVEDVLRAKNNYTELLYISFPKNIEQDIPEDFEALELNVPDLNEEKCYKIITKI